MYICIWVYHICSYVPPIPYIHINVYVSLYRHRLNIYKWVCNYIIKWVCNGVTSTTHKHPQNTRLVYKIVIKLRMHPLKACISTVRHPTPQGNRMGDFGVCNPPLYKTAKRASYGSKGGSRESLGRGGENITI